MVSCNVMSVLACGSQARRRSAPINTLSQACSQGGNTSSEALSAMTVGTHLLDSQEQWNISRHRGKHKTWG